MKNLYRVVHPFAAATAISGRDRDFRPGELLDCDPSQEGGTVILEVDGFLYLAERATFEACCKFEGGAVA